MSTDIIFFVDHEVSLCTNCLKYSHELAVLIFCTEENMYVWLKLWAKGVL